MGQSNSFGPIHEPVPGFLGGNGKATVRREGPTVLRASRGGDLATSQVKGPEAFKTKKGGSEG